MPEVVMKIILEKSGLQAIQTLRKVCSFLRNFIDDSKPDPRVSSLRIWVAPKRISVSYDEISIRYQKNLNGCMVIHQKKEKLLETSEEFWKFALEDLNSNLIYQKSIIDEFEILHGGIPGTSFRDNILEPFLKTLGTFLASRPRPLSVKLLEMDPLKQWEVMAVLPFLCPNSLEEIRIEYSFFMDHKPVDLLDIDEIAKLPQWKNIKKLTATLYLNVENFMEHFGHIETISLSLDWLTSEDLVAMKETVLHSQKLADLEFDFQRSNEEQPFGEQAHNENDRYNYWFFNDPTDSNSVLRIRYDQFLSVFRFQFFDRKSIPKGVIVM